MAVEDRRVRRTKRLLREALVALVLDTSYGAVTVEDITERADLSRATFYGHYTDKDDLLDRIVADLVAELDDRLRPLLADPTEGFTGRPVLEMFRHAREERDLYRIVLRGEGDGRALRQFTELRVAAVARIFGARAAAHGVTPRIDLDVLARAWVGEQLAALSWWVEADIPPYPAEEMATMLRDLSLRGRYWATGFDDTEIPAP